MSRDTVELCWVDECTLYYGHSGKHNPEATEEERQDRRDFDMCPFCNIIKQLMGDHTIPFDVYPLQPLDPVTEGHMLFISGYHLLDAGDDPIRTGSVMVAASEYAAAQGCDYNLITSSGSAATQTVKHLHIHYVPRRYGDKLKLPWSGQKHGKQLNNGGLNNEERWCNKCGEKTPHSQQRNGKNRYGPGHLFAWRCLVCRRNRVDKNETAT